MQKKSHFHIFRLFFLAIMIFSCSKGPDYARSYGPDATVFRPLTNFNKVRIGEKFQLFITADSLVPEGISISYGSHLIEKISTEIKDSLLVIEDKNGFNWVRSFKHFPVCTLNIRHLNSIRIEGAAEVTCLDSIVSPKLEVQMNSVGKQYFLTDCGQLAGACSNSGSIVFKGRGTIFAWTCEDGGSVDARDMFCHDAYLFHYSALNAHIKPLNKLEAWVYGTGNIYYYADPLYSSKKNEFGRGKIERR
jgi:hypothetical protein